MRTNKNEQRRQPFALAVAATAAMLFTACDTSSLQSGIEGTGITNPVTTAAVSRGPIESVDGFDVAVNGVTWSAVNAKTFIDGAAGSPLDLKPGMMATVQGERTAPDRGTATVIETQIVVRGPILEINAATNRLNVLGQLIFVNRDTKFEVPGASFAALSVGQVVAVSGFVDSNDQVRATLIATPIGAGAAEWIVNGAVTAVDPGARRFAINGLAVAYTDDLLAGLPSGAIEVGQALTVAGRSLTNDVLTATRIVSYDPSLPTTDGEIVLTGIVARLEGDKFLLLGYRIVLPSGAPEDLTDGAFIRVAGRMFGGILYASDLLVFGSGQRYDYLIGYIEAVDVAAGTVTIFGVEFRVGGTDSLRGLAVGDWVTFTAYANRFISAIGRATPNFYPVQVVGEFLDLSPPVQFTLRGVTDWIVQVTDAKFAYDWVTRLDGECYAIPVSAERFWELAAQPKPPGVTSVWAAGRFEGGILLASVVGICFPSEP
jgi:hypothetical protein